MPQSSHHKSQPRQPVEIQTAPLPDFGMWESPTPAVFLPLLFCLSFHRVSEFGFLWAIWNGGKCALDAHLHDYIIVLPILDSRLIRRIGPLAGTLRQRSGRTAPCRADVIAA